MSPVPIRPLTADAPPAEHLAPFVERALDAIGREYPYHMLHLVRSDADARPPRELTPAFAGSFDWHSAVHSHWCVVRGLRCGVSGPLAARAVVALDRCFAPGSIDREVEYMAAPERAGFERPYGLAWLVLLGAELREWQTPRAFGWHATLRPLEQLAMERMTAWLPKLPWPIRSGEHGQTAFALGLVLDAARIAGDLAAERLVVERARAFHLADRAAPIAYEPSGHDFLSPVLGEADLMRRVLGTAEYAQWLARFLPDLSGPVARAWLTPVVSPDQADGKLAHLDGLNLSRAWMLEGVVSALAEDHPHRALLGSAAAGHRSAGVAAAAATEHYAGTHWLGSFAMYLLTRRGLR